jgi:hypothetical protein
MPTPAVEFPFYQQTRQNGVVAPGAGATNVLNLGGTSALVAVAAIATAQVRLSKPTAFRNLRVYISANAVAANSCVLSLDVNGTPSALTVTILPATGVGWLEDLTNEVRCLPGDLVCWKFVAGATVGAPTINQILVDESSQ